MGHSCVNAQDLTAPPFFLSFLATIVSVYVADKTQQRGTAVIVLSMIGFTGYVLLATCNTIGVRYIGVFLAAAGIFPTIANILPWVLSECSFPCNPESLKLIVFYFETIKARILAVVLGSPS